MAGDSDQHALRASSDDGDRFEILVAEMSARFMTLDPGDLDVEIERSLAAAGQFMGVDRCFVFQLSEDGSEYQVSHMWTADRVAPDSDVIGLIVRERFPWLIENIESRIDIIVSDTDALPEEAFREAQYCREESNPSSCVPCTRGTQSWETSASTSSAGPRTGPAKT